MGQDREEFVGCQRLQTKGRCPAPIAGIFTPLDDRLFLVASLCGLMLDQDMESLLGPETYSPNPPGGYEGGSEEIQIPGMR
jgi:hypothetical protein